MKNDNDTPEKMADTNLEELLHVYMVSYTIGREISAVETFRCFIIQCTCTLREYFAIFIFASKVDHENFITVQFL